MRSSRLAALSPIWSCLDGVRGSGGRPGATKPTTGICRPGIPTRTTRRVPQAMGLSWFTVTRQAYVSRWARRRDAADALHALGLTLAGGRSRVISRTLPRRRIRTASSISGFVASFRYGGAVAAPGVGMVQEPDRRSTCRLGGRSNGIRRSSSPAGRPQVLALANFLASAPTAIMPKSAELEIRKVGICPIELPSPRLPP
jgi:hypothetical protein